MTCRKPLYSTDEVSVSQSPMLEYTPERGIQKPLPVNVEDENSARSDEIDEIGIESEDKVSHTGETDSDTEEDSLQLESFSPPTTEKHQCPSTPQNPAPTEQVKKPSAQLLTAKQSNLIPILFVFAILLLLIAYKWPKQETKLKQCAFNELRNRTPLQSEDVWSALKNNIELLLNKKTKSPNVYLLLHSNQSSQSHIQRLIHDIALETSKCFDDQQPIEMNLEDFETKHGDDYGYPIEQYKKKLKEGNVFLIVNLNDIPPKAARALHTICDTYSPIAPDVIIFLTLRTYHKTTGATPSKLAHQMLHELWQEMPDNELDALITRVIDQVLLLQG